MLAHKFDEKRVDFNQPTYIQPKLDGVRCNIYLNDNNDIVCYSRTGKQFMNLRHIELYNHKLKHDFEKIISLVRKQKPTDEDRINAQHLIQFHCYDYFSQDSHYETYKHRMHQLVTSDIYSACVKYVPAKLVDSYGYARTLHQEYLDQGYEGSIIRLNGLYKHGRSYDLMKFKDFSDTEATIIGYETGKGKREGTIGKFLMQDDDGNKFGCPPGKGYNYKDLANILDNIGDYIGKRATFTYFQRTNAGSYRHPLFKAIRNYE